MTATSREGLLLCTAGASFVLFVLFGSALLVPLAVVLGLVVGVLVRLHHNGVAKTEELSSRFDSYTKTQISPGLTALLRTAGALSEDSEQTQQHKQYEHAARAAISQSSEVDALLEQMLDYVMRDYVHGWYTLFSDDRLLAESLKRTCRRTFGTLSRCLVDVDWVRLLTRDVVDDIATHVRLYRVAAEVAEQRRREAQLSTHFHEELESLFFDAEAEMEPTGCRDLVSTTPQYESAYQHDVADVLLYLLMPGEDFRSRPLRFLLREVVVRRVLAPLADYFSDSDNLNLLVVWLLSDVTPRTDDFVTVVQTCESVEELDSLLILAREHAAHLRSRDRGGHEGSHVKEELASLEYLEVVIKERMRSLAGLASAQPTADSIQVQTQDALDALLVQLPLHVVLTHPIAVSFFIDYLNQVGGQNLIDCWLAIEGFKASVEHQQRGLAAAEVLHADALETVREAALSMHAQYLSEEAVTFVNMDESLIAQLLAKIRAATDPPDSWFDRIQEKIVKLLKTDERFYPGFRRDSLYVQMLVELDIDDAAALAAASSRRSDSPSVTSSPRHANSNASPRSDDGTSSSAMNASSTSVTGSTATSSVDLQSTASEETRLSAVVETVGVGQLNGEPVAIYNVRVARTQNGCRVSSWNVIRRYSHFHTLHSTVVSAFPRLVNISFPGKKTFNNLDAHFLERRTKALNAYLQCLLEPSLLRSTPGLERIVFDFLSQKDYQGEPRALGKKMFSAVFDPIRTGVKAVGAAVTAVPDHVVDGVSKVGDGIEKAARLITGTTAVPQATVGSSEWRAMLETDRVVGSTFEDGASIENIPLRVLVLFVEELFGVRARNQWLRRQLFAVLTQLVMPLGSSINRRILDLVQWLTSAEQTVSYLTVFRDWMWPDGQLGESPPPRSASHRLRTQILARTLLLSAVPDELRLVLGTDTTMRGANTLYAALQRPSLNRRIFYVLMERMLIALFPANNFSKIFAQLHSKSPRTKF